MAMNTDAHFYHPVLKSDKFTVLPPRCLRTWGTETCPMHKKIEYVITKIVILPTFSLYYQDKIHKKKEKC
jgi:hypothetical protein